MWKPYAEEALQLQENILVTELAIARPDVCLFVTGPTYDFVLERYFPGIRFVALDLPEPTWVGVFYPPGTKPADYLSAYAEKYDCVEVDSTFYSIPTQSMVAKWYADTPAGFTFAAKVPQAVTHDKVLLDCQEDLSAFLNVMDGLKEKLGPLARSASLLQQGHI